MTIKTKIDFPDYSVILFADLEMHPETGVYCKLWSVYQVTSEADLHLSRRFLKEHDVTLMPANDLIELAEELKSIIVANTGGFEHFKHYYSHLIAN